MCHNLMGQNVFTVYILSKYPMMKYICSQMVKKGLQLDVDKMLDGSNSSEVIIYAHKSASKWLR